MPILIKMNLGCDWNCKYCYQIPVKQSGEAYLKWDIKKVEESVRDLISKKKDKQIVIHGGEPLNIPVNDFERLLALSYELTNASSIQTNGFYINDEYIKLFKKYNTSVGVSIDGPGECNIFRGKGNTQDRLRQADKVISNLKKLVDNGINTSVISVISKANGLPKQRNLMKKWLLNLKGMNIAGRLNICSSDDPEISLSIDEATDFYEDIFYFCLREGIYGWSPFKDIMNSLKGDSNVVCVFRGCDPYSTPSAISVLYDGSLGVCIRLYSDGHLYLRDASYLPSRSQVLQQTDCKGCEWFPYCNGGCPGLSLDLDWRRKDRYCELYKHLFHLVSNTMKSLGIKISDKKEAPLLNWNTHHSDGIEHIDSGTEMSHGDGIEHLDGSTRHLDSG